MYWPSRTDFVSTIPLSAWWYVTNTSPDALPPWNTTKVCATTGQAILCRMQKILRDGLLPPWTDSQGSVHTARPLVTGILDMLTLEALWAYAHRCAGIPDAQVPLVQPCPDPLFSHDEGSNVPLPLPQTAAQQALLEFAREGLYLACARERPMRGLPLFSRMIRPDGKLVATSFFTAGAVWFSYYVDTLEAFAGSPASWVPALMGAQPREAIAFSLLELRGMPVHEPIDADFFEFAQTAPTPSQLARLATLKPMCSLAKDMAVPSSLQSDAALEWMTISTGKLRLEDTPVVKATTTSPSGKTEAEQLDELEARQALQRAEIDEIDRAMARARQLTADMNRYNADQRVERMRAAAQRASTRQQDSTGPQPSMPMKTTTSTSPLLLLAGLALIGAGLSMAKG